MTWHDTKKITAEPGSPFRDIETSQTTARQRITQKSMVNRTCPNRARINFLEENKMANKMTRKCTKKGASQMSPDREYFFCNFHPDGKPRGWKNGMSVYRQISDDQKCGGCPHYKKELYHRHYWVSDTRVVSEWHLASNTHPHPQESDIEYQYRVSECDEGEKIK